MPLSAVREFLRHESAGGVVLLAAALVAFLLTNSPLSAAYLGLFDLHLTLKLGGLGLDKSLGHWINDGLMAIFFLFVGLEIKREFLDGQLASWPRRALPGIAAAGGMAVPAMISTAPRSSMIASAARKTLSEVGTLSPSSDSTPSAKAMSVADGMAQPRSVAGSFQLNAT